MKAIAIETFGAPEGLRLVERPLPEPAPGEVLIKVHAFGVNRPDVLQRKGHYPPPPGVSDLPGLEVAGTVVGGEVTLAAGFGLGDRVCALIAGGGYAEYVCAPVGSCLPVPDGMSDTDAASLPETFFTVWSNVFDRAGLGRGENGAAETFLVHGGTSGIGVAAIQLASAFGFRVFATAGSAEKCAACEALGASKAINYKTEDFVDVIRALTDGRGVDVILDMVAGDYIPRDMSILADGGRIAILALLGGAKAQVDLGAILKRRLTLTGSTLRARPNDFKARIAAQLRAQVWPMLASGRIRAVVHEVLPAADAPRAHALMESSAHIGKIVMVW